MPQASNGTDPAAHAAAGALNHHSDLLSSILEQLRVERIAIGLSDATRQGMVLAHHPVTGAKRVLAYRTGNGFAAFAVPTTGVLVFPANEARIGLTLINSGTFPIVLYLSDTSRGGVPCVYLAPNGSWDGRFGTVDWAGNVFGVAQGTASQLTGGEL